MGICYGYLLGYLLWVFAIGIAKNSKSLWIGNVDMQLWTWKNWQGKPFLTCDLLPWDHGFFTQHFYPALPEALTQAIAPSAQVYRVKQVHSAEVLTPTAIDQAVGQAMDAAIAAGLPAPEDSQSIPLPLADGVVSDQPEQAVWTCSADCTPALIGDVVTGQVAAVHAGWRGTAQKILPAAVLQFKTQGSELKNLRIALGPAIDGRVYQVGHDVAAEVGLTVTSAVSGQKRLSAEKLSVEAVVAHLMALENPPLLSDPEENRVRLDVRRINHMQLEQLGIEADQIAIAPHCTYQDPENFFSYRRTHEKKVQWSGIVSR